MPAPETSAENLNHRDLCLRCLRARSVCQCARLEPFSPSFEVILLQHPKERKNSIGTARMTHLCLANSQLIPGVEFETDPRVSEILSDPLRHCVVLFPGGVLLDRGEERKEFVESAVRGGRRITVFVIDGTWPHAKVMVRRSPRLAALPRVGFDPDRPSQYRVRKQPAQHCLSTIEAVHRLIQILDPSAPADRLMEQFLGMVNRQVECAGQRALREIPAREPAG